MMECWGKERDREANKGGKKWKVGDKRRKGRRRKRLGRSSRIIIA